MRTLIIGAGKSGVAAANFLAARGEEVSITDSNANPALPYPLDRSVTRVFGQQDGALLDDVGMIVLSPGVPTTIPLLLEAGSLGIPVIGEIELAYRNIPRGSTIIAVTGSNGKSTTTTLIGEILKVDGRQPIVAGNIGEPLIASLDPDRPRTYVLELSSFQLETVDTFRADVALLLNVTPDHMDRYPTFDAYAAAKYRVFRNQQPHDVAIVNAADRRGQPRDLVSRLWRFSAAQRVDEGAFLDGDDLVLRIDSQERRIPRASLKLEGTANVENALAAWLAVRAARRRRGERADRLRLVCGVTASHGPRVRARRRPLDQRFEGNECRRHTQITPVLPAVERLADPGRQRQGRRVRADA